MRLTSICLALLLATLPVSGQEDALPDFGEAGVLPVGQEYTLGRAWLMSFRSQAPIVDDPILQDYVETMVYRLGHSISDGAAEMARLADERMAARKQRERV